MSKELIFTATYCEAENIETWVRQVHKARPDSDILIIDDNSPDGTAQIVENLRHELPQVGLVIRDGKFGLGSAHTLAMQMALSGSYDILVTMDADLSHQPCQIKALLDVLEPGGCVVGTRTNGGSHQAPLLRRALSRAANLTARALVPTGLSEYTSSMRVFTPDALKILVATDFHYSGYAFFIECIEVLHLFGIPLKEAPIDFLDRRSGHSKIPKNQIFLSAFALSALSIRRLNKAQRSNSS